MYNFDGVVWLRGAVAGAASGNPILTVPVAYFPASTVTFSAIASYVPVLSGSSVYFCVTLTLSKAGVLSVTYSSNMCNAFVDLSMFCHDFMSCL